ncbi:pro-neuregulin-1, membrane-bound isoform isoform IIa [Danio rerio]|uniref:Neuregulin 1 n=1 Tax=Danio rerio TaxID=7955 RepID=A0A0R4IDP7_DANRE|nr:pro-neuregulin-1, membrane-bound isoform isoform IIa [Danio rerio]|eukprot:NP_001264013.1 pro-neuregulin-1, membrane-bound isoform isoform IIa [Danio rerio]
MAILPGRSSSLTVSVLYGAAVCLSLWTRVVRCGSFACSPPGASVQELARRSGVVFEGKLQEEERAERNWTETPMNASRQVRVRVQQVWQLKAGGLIKDSVVSLVWFEGGRCFQLNTGIRYMFFIEPTNDTSVFTAVFPPVETKRTVRKDVSQVLCQDCAEPKLKNLRSVTVEDGKKTVLKCEILAGNPAPNVKWYKNGKELTGKNKPKSIKIKKKKQGKISELLIRKSTEGDAGLYTCEAVNSLGKTNTTANLFIINTATSTTPSAKTSSHVTPCNESEKEYCVNHGKCFTLEVTPGNIRRLCRCPPGFTGNRCQNRDPVRVVDHKQAEELYQKRVLTITGICIALLVVGIMCVVAYCKTKKQRKKLHDRLRQSLRERNAAAKGPQHPHPPPENLQLVNHYMPTNPVPAHMTDKEAETSLSTNEFTSPTHPSTAITHSSSQCWSNGKAESVVSDSHAVLMKPSAENCQHGTPSHRGRLNATGGVHQLNDYLKNSREAQGSNRDSPYSERYVSAMTTPTRLSPVGLLSPVTPSSPPSEMSAPLSSLATSVPSMLTSPSGEEERPLLFRTPPILRDKSASTQGRKSGHNLRNSAHYNHGLDIPSPPPSPLHIEEEIDCLEQYKSTSVPSSAPHSPSAARTQPSGQAAPEQAVSGSNSESSSSESETEDERVGEDTPFLGLQNPLAAGSLVLDGLEGSRTNPALHLSPQHELQNRLTAVMANQDPIAV